MLRWIGLQFARNAIEPFNEQLPQGPPGTVTGKHIQVMDMVIRITVSLPDFRWIDMAQPVIRCNLARDIQDHPTKGIALVGIRLDTPVSTVNIFLH